MIATVAGTLPLWMDQGAVASESSIKNKRESIVKVLAAYAKVFKYLGTPASKEKYVQAYMASGGTQASGELEWDFIYKNTAYSPALTLPPG